MTKIKICGITNFEDARLAAELGADALGFNFYAKSPRFISPETAGEIIARLPAAVLKVGVFVNEDPERIAGIAKAAGLGAIQLHGDESPEYAAELKASTGLLVIKALRVGSGFRIGDASKYRVDAILLDGYSAENRGGTGETFDWNIAKQVKEVFPVIYLAGGLSVKNAARAVREVEPFAIDACSGLELRIGVKDANLLKEFIAAIRKTDGKYEPNSSGFWGEYGGSFVPETLVSPLAELTDAYSAAREDPEFQAEFQALLRDYAGRPTPLTHARRLSEQVGGAKIYLKREDLLHTGAHKINNALGQVLLAIRNGKNRIIAETGAGQHGVATATVCALFGLQCVIYMGTEDMRRQSVNVFRMRLLGAEVRAVDAGSRTLKDAINEALRDWVANVETTHYLLGSALGPHPYPLMVRDFQTVIGKEAREQILEKEGRLPDCMIACVGGGSNSIGLFHPFLPDESVRMIGVEAGGKGSALGDHAARFDNTSGNRVGVLQGTKSYLLQDENGQIALTHSISAGLDYASIGPEHAYLHDIGRVEYASANDQEALAAFRTLSRTEGIIPALETAHGVAHALKIAREMSKDQAVIVNLSGRGDKDIDTVVAELNK